MITKLSDVKHLKLGNTKLPDDMAVFDLPAEKTCPGATALCKQFCYAKKAEMYPAVSPFRFRNMSTSTTEEFVDIITNELLFLNKKKGINKIRIHSSGDFYSQKYLEKWFAIATKLPNIIFYAYTKSWYFDFSKHPDNFILFYSTDKTTTHTDLPKGINNIAHMVDYKVPIGNEVGKSCWDFTKNTNGKCKTCSYCYNGGQDERRVVFYKH